MLGDRKVCGVLTEVVARGHQPTTVVGIGVNVNVDPAAADLPSTATSLAHTCGRWFPRGTVLRAILDRVDSYLDLPDEAARQHILEKWEALLWGREQVIRVDDAGSSVEGAVLGLSPDGALRIRTRSGEERQVSIGDVWLAG
jgi:BirA family biotin operon repressor/biotin-[acetyl-CoA-carboxylase] ligase